jgi:hypothetical protein
MVEFQYNNHIHSGTQKTPFYLDSGDALRSDITLLKLLIYKNARQTNPSFAGYG